MQLIFFLCLFIIVVYILMEIGVANYQTIILLYKQTKNILSNAVIQVKYP